MAVLAGGQPVGATPDMRYPGLSSGHSAPPSPSKWKLSLKLFHGRSSPLSQAHNDRLATGSKSFIESTSDVRWRFFLAQAYLIGTSCYLWNMNRMDQEKTVASSRRG